MRQAPWYSIAAIFVSMVVMGVLGFAYTRHVQHENNQRFCNVFSFLDDGYKATPPTTAAGKEFAKRIHELRIGLDCE